MGVSHCHTTLRGTKTPRAPQQSSACHPACHQKAAACHYPTPLLNKWAYGWLVTWSHSPAPANLSQTQAGQTRETPFSLGAEKHPVPRACPSAIRDMKQLPPGTASASGSARQTPRPGQSLQSHSSHTARGKRVSHHHSVKSHLTPDHGHGQMSQFLSTFLTIRIYFNWQ